MNKYKVGKFLLLPLLCGTIEACDKFEAFPLEYENTPQDDAVENVLNNINPAWELELLERNDYVVAFKDKKYDKLFTRTLGWNGGDGVLTTQLPDGNTFWSFNDSWYGVVDGETRSRDGNKVNFPRNTIMVQTPGDKEENLVWLADFSRLLIRMLHAIIRHVLIFVIRRRPKQMNRFRKEILIKIGYIGRVMLLFIIINYRFFGME